MDKTLEEIRADIERIKRELAAMEKRIAAFEEQSRSLLGEKSGGI